MLGRGENDGVFYFRGPELLRTSRLALPLLMRDTVLWHCARLHDESQQTRLVPYKYKHTCHTYRTVTKKSCFHSGPRFLICLFLCKTFVHCCCCCWMGGWMDGWMDSSLVASDGKKKRCKAMQCDAMHPAYQVCRHRMNELVS